MRSPRGFRVLERLISASAGEGDVVDDVVEALVDGCGFAGALAVVTAGEAPRRRVVVDDDADGAVRALLARSPRCLDELLAGGSVTGRCTSCEGAAPHAVFALERGGTRRGALLVCGGDDATLSALGRVVPSIAAAVEGGTAPSRPPSSPEVVESQSTLVSLLASIDQLVVGLDLDGRFSFVHAPKTTRLYAPPSVFLGRHAREVLPPAMAAKVDAALDQLRSGADATQLTYDLEMGGARSWWVARLTVRRGERGEPLGYTVVCREVTEKKLADDVLRESELRYRLLVESLDDVVFIADQSDVVTFVNRAIAQFGFAPDQVIGRHRYSFVHRDDVERVKRHNGAPAGEAARPIEYVLVDAQSRPRIVRSTSRPLVVGGRRLGTIGVVTDLTRQRETEEQLRVAQKMEAIGRLAGGVAHDFNNLLTVIVSHAELTLLTVGVGDPAHDDLVAVVDAARRAEGLTRQLLTFSRKQRLSPRPIVLSKLVAQVAALLRRVIGEDVSLDLSLDSDRLTLVDRGQIEQVLMNLVANARDAMPGGGSITVGTADVSLDDARASVLGVAPGSYIKLTVRDTGHGIDDAVRPHIFEPFFTTRPTGKGTGLGLSTVYGIVKHSGGTVDVVSRAGEGATFVVYLPCHEGSNDAVGPQSSRGAVSGGTETLLLVEDEPALRDVAARILRQAGYHVLSAANGDEALKIVAERAADIALVVTDVVMPGMNGKQLVERIAPLCPQAGVLFTSGYADEAIGDLVSQGRTLLPKPYDVTALTRAVREALDRRAVR